MIDMSIAHTITDRLCASGMLGLVGHTPLAPLAQVLDYPRVKLFGKLEMFNPGGSIKDRVALSILRDALERGTIDQSTTVIESSSGNLGIGLAQTCLVLGLRFVCVIDSRTTQQNIKILQTYGAKVELVSTPDPDLLSARIKRVQALRASIPNSFWCNQYANLNNARAHYHTMHEISVALEGRVDYLFCATSSCGTLLGCAEYIRQHGLRTTVIAVDAEGSVIFGGAPGQRLIPGHGAARVPELFREGLANDVVHVSDRDCVLGCRRLLQREGLLAGGSSGAVIAAVGRYQKRLPRGASVVAILCDRGERYLDTIYSECWVAEHFPDLPPTHAE